jgi:hypothetical protein
MKRSYLLLSAAMIAAQSMCGQTLTAVTGLRLYEHHSPMIAPQGANGSQSGYNFVNRVYFYSYNASNMGAYTGNQPDSIDMVEHNGPYSTKRMFGFTSGVSTIWNGDIKGNGITKWMEAPASFNYSTANNVQQIVAAYDSTKAKQNVDTVKANTTYLGRIRNTGLYVAMRTSTVKNRTTNDNNVYFDFEYKYGTALPTGIDDAKTNGQITVYPNPAYENVSIGNPTRQAMSIRLVSVHGQTIQSFSLGAGDKTTIDLNGLARGLYFLKATTEEGLAYAQQLIKY